VLGPVSTLLPPRDAPPLSDHDKQVILAMVERRSRYALDAAVTGSPNATVH